MTELDRRGALILGTSVMLSGVAAGAAQAAAPALEPEAATTLRALSATLAAMPRRRDFRARPMIPDNPELWDDAPLQALLAYKGGPRQVWDNTDLTGPWLNLMRNSLNSQVWGFRKPDFLCASATHGPAHLALYDQASWDKYQLAKIAGGSVAGNSFLGTAPARDAGDFQSPEGVYAPRGGNTIAVLQERGAVFLACHNAIWELASRLDGAGHNPDRLGVQEIAAELANHLVPGVVLTPGAVATVVHLQEHGFAYAR